MKAAELMVKALENEGVKYIFGIPGEENLDFLEAIRTSSLELVITRHEQAAGFMAATLGRLTGKPGVCLSTLGPGATNFVTAAAYAQLGAMPMMMITGQKPIKKSKQGRFQIVDVVDMMRPLTKYTRQIVTANAIPSIVREAFRLASIERPGAVHLELPEDVAAEEIDAPLIAAKTIRRPSPNTETIAEAVQMIHQAKRPLILIGAGANRKLASEELRTFVESSGIYFINTQMGKGVVDERHPLFLGTAALSEGDYLHCALDRSDLVINIGHDVVEKPPFFMEPGGKKVIHVNFRSAEIDEVYLPQLVCPGELAHSVAELTKRVEPQDSWDFDYYRRIKEDLESHLSDCDDDSSFPVKPQRIVADVRRAMPADGIVALDNGMYKIWFARNYKAYERNTLLLDNALASMGAGLPSAMAATLLYPDRKVLAVCGDGGFMMNSQELETAVRMRMNLTVLILNDNAFGMIKWKQDVDGFPQFGLDYSNPDFIQYAQSYRAHGVRIESTDDLLPTLKKCVATEGVHLIECPMDYSENKRVLVDELQQKTCLL